MIVCVCNAVSHHQIISCVGSGAVSLEQVAEACGAGADCGSCHQEVEVLIEGVTTGRLASAQNSLPEHLRTTSCQSPTDRLSRTPPAQRAGLGVSGDKPSSTTHTGVLKTA